MTATPLILEVIVQGYRFIAAHIPERPGRDFLRQFDAELDTFQKPFFIAIDRDNTPLQRFAQRRGAEFRCYHGPHWIGIQKCVIH